MYGIFFVLRVSGIVCVQYLIFFFNWQIETNLVNGAVRHAYSRASVVDFVPCDQIFHLCFVISDLVSKHAQC